MATSTTLRTSAAKLLEFIQDRFASPLLHAPFGASCPCTMVTNQDNMVVGYAVGDLRYGENPPRFEGELRHYFSDRHWADPVVQGIKPFSPRSTERTLLTLWLMTPERIAVTLTSFTREAEQTTVQIMGCEGNVLYGIGPGIGAQSPSASYLISIIAPLALPG